MPNTSSRFPRLRLLVPVGPGVYLPEARRDLPILDVECYDATAPRAAIPAIRKRVRMMGAA